jgi:hypothetical protein
MFNRGHRPARRILGILAAGALVAALAATTYAAIPGSNGVISACKDAKGGLKVIDAENGATCSANQVALNWNQQGPTGATGATGPAGPSDATWVVSYGTPVTATSFAARTVLGAFYLDPGSYVITAKLNVEPKILNVAPMIVNCMLATDGNGGLYTYSKATVASDGTGPTQVGTEVMTLAKTFSVQPSVEVSCWAPASGQAVQATNVVITAIHVGAVN